VSTWNNVPNPSIAWQKKKENTERTKGIKNQQTNNNNNINDSGIEKNNEKFYTSTKWRMLYLSCNISWSKECST
jgi:hypothetical protein